MNYKKYFYILSKLVALSIIFSVIIHGSVLAFSFGNSEAAQKEAVSSQKTVFHSAYRAQAAGAGIAISTRIGMGSNQSASSSSSKQNGNYKYSSGEALTHEFISENLILIREYLNYSRADISAELKKNSQKSQTLDAYISGFSSRASSAQSSIASLEKRKEETLIKLENTSTNIEAIKANMEGAFSQSEATRTLEEVQKYYEQRQLYTRYFTQIVFINQFLKQYNFLINYNDGILQTIKLNKQAIVNGSFLVVPESGDQYLRTLELLFEESEKAGEE